VQELLLPLLKRCSAYHGIENMVSKILTNFSCIKEKIAVNKGVILILRLAKPFLLQLPFPVPLQRTLYKVHIVSL